MTSRPMDRARLRLVPNHEPQPSPSAPVPALDDSELLAAVRLGDPDAAGSLYARLRPVVMRTVGRLLGYGDPDAEDLAQQAMIEIVSTIDRYRGEAPLQAWASTIAAHVVYKAIRRRKTERRIFDGAPYDELVGPRSAPTGRAAARSTLARVKVHLDAMDAAKAWTYLLHDVCGYDLKEVASITETSVAAAQSRLVRGRRELHERIAQDPDLAHALAELGGES